MSLGFLPVGGESGEGKTLVIMNRAWKLTDQGITGHRKEDRSSLESEPAPVEIVVEIFLSKSTMECGDKVDFFLILDELALLDALF